MVMGRDSRARLWDLFHADPYRPTRFAVVGRCPRSLSDTRVQRPEPPGTRRSARADSVRAYRELRKICRRRLGSLHPHFAERGRTMKPSKPTWRRFAQRQFIQTVLRKGHATADCIDV